MAHPSARGSRLAGLLPRRTRRGKQYSPLSFFMTTPAAIAPRPRCTRAASTDRHADVAVVLIDDGARVETPGGPSAHPLDNAVGSSLLARRPTPGLLEAPG